ncbi:MAG: hypothetical protein WKF87_11980 [Chryseolinea sp.]
MFFFTEADKLNSQPKPYGPLPVGPDTKFQVTSNFTLTEKAKAFAVQESLLIVLPSTDPSLVNVILKPISALGISFATPRYYIYRGLLKNGFFNGLTIKPASDPDSSDLVKRIWKNIEVVRLIIPAAADPTPTYLGYDATVVDTLAIEDLYAGQSPSFSGVRVREGEWIGDFNTDCGFEIITDTDTWFVDKGYMKKIEHVIDVSTMLSGTDEQKFSLRVARESILRYMDPAAFWGLYFYKGLQIFDATQTTKRKKVIGESLYTDLISKYATKNRVYLDIRNEKGYSYNFNKNYGDPAASGSDYKLKTDRSHTYINGIYNRHWPIYYSDGGGLEANTHSNFYIQLRTDDNIKPILFFENPVLIPSTTATRFLDETKLLSGDTSGWTKDIVLKFPNVAAGAGPRMYVANYLSLQYFRKESSPSSPATVLSTPDFFDRLFCGISNFSVSSGPKLIQRRNSKLQMLTGNNYTLVARSGVYSGPEYVMLYTKAHYANSTSTNMYPKMVSQLELKPLIDAASFPKDIYFNKWQLQLSPNPVDVIEIVGYNENKTATPKENLFLLGLSKAEFLTLTGLSGFHPDLPKYIVLEPVAGPLGDSLGFSFLKYKVKVRGFKPDGTTFTAAPSTDISVYSSGSNMYCSAAFTTLMTHLPSGARDPLKGDFQLSHWLYKKADAAALLGTDGMVTVPDKSNNGLNVTSQVKVALEGHAYFPADRMNGPISQSKPSHPVVLIVHANGQRYDQYQQLGILLAINGFIAVSIDCRFQHDTFKLHATQGPDATNFPYYFIIDETYALDTADKIFDANNIALAKPWIKGTHYTVESDHSSIKLNFKLPSQEMGGLGRVNLIFKHLELIERKFGSQANVDKIAIFGHSRGGEAAIMAANLNPNPTKYKISSLVSLAPTDQFENSTLTKDIPYFVLYGSRDGDVNGMPTPPGPMRSGGFTLWDRAVNSSLKTMAFVYKATHNGFIKDNHDYIEVMRKDLTKFILPDPTHLDSFLLQITTQKNICIGYTNAFLRYTLFNENSWRPLFTGEWTPPSIVFSGSKGIYFQFQNKASDRLPIEDFESDGSAVSTIKPGWKKGKLRDLPADISKVATNADQSSDPYSPHDTKALSVKWVANDKIHFKVSDEGLDVSSYSAISFRITKIAFAAGNANINTMQVGLNDAFMQKVGKHVVIPDPDLRPSTSLGDNETLTSKSAMMTARIPLEVFTAGGIDLTKITNIQFLFPQSGNGSVDIDSVEFTK